MTCPSAEGNRNALLAFHFGEGDARDAARMRAHVESCAACRAYRAELTALTTALAGWHDEAPPAATAERIVARAVQSPQAPATGRPKPQAGALPLLALLPVMGALVHLIGLVATWLPALSFWPRLDQWPTLEPVVPFAAATVALLLIGGLAALAAAPALVMESRRQES
jgi:anti-sigma factor RsiW